MKIHSLGMLTIVPVAAFALNSFMYPGGDKDKKKKAETARIVVSSQAANNVSTFSQEQNQPATSRNRVEAKPLTREYLKLEITRGFAQFEAEIAAANASDETGENVKMKPKFTNFTAGKTAVELPEATRTFIETKLVERVEKEFYGELDANEFSRCPSGIRSFVYAIDEAGQNGEGYLLQWSGCRQHWLGKFQYNAASENITMWISNDVGYVSYAEWLRAYKDWREESDESNG